MHRAECVDVLPKDYSHVFAIVESLSVSCEFASKVLCPRVRRARGM
jgi:hypothetical protein